MPEYNAAKHYRGKPCPHGHTLRYRKTHRCVACANKAVIRSKDKLPTR